MAVKVVVSVIQTLRMIAYCHDVEVLKIRQVVVYLARMSMVAAEIYRGIYLTWGSSYATHWRSVALLRARNRSAINWQVPRICAPGIPWVLA